MKEQEKEDVAAGGTKLFKGERVRDVVECSKCSKVRCIYAMYSLNSKQSHKLSR